MTEVLLPTPLEDSSKADLRAWRDAVLEDSTAVGTPCTMTELSEATAEVLSSPLLLTAYASSAG